MQILIPLAILFLLFWFFVALPQRRRQRAHASMQDALGVGDEVITAGGLHGDVVEIDETVLRVEIAPGTVVRVDRRAVAARVEAAEAPSATGAEPG
jgi:preprotein translocase subunit YajC